MALIRLSEDKTLHVAEDEPKLQHYGFYNDEGHKLGSIKDLIADTDTMKVRFLIVSWHEGVFDRKDLIIPLQDVTIDLDAKRVICSNCTTERLNAYPEYKGGMLPDLTKRFRATFLPQDQAMAPKGEAAPMAGTTQRATTDEPVMEVIEEELQVGKRDVPLGEAVIRKTVTEHEVCEPVELRQERVEIERHAVHRPSDVAPGTGDMEVHVPLMGQEIVKNKTAFVKEEITLHRIAETNRQEVCDTVRSEDVDTSNIERQQKTDVGAEPVVKTDLAGDKVDMGPNMGTNEDLGRPDHLYDEPRDRPVL